MTDGSEIFKFSPKCFQKDLQILFTEKKDTSSFQMLMTGRGNNRIFEAVTRNSLIFKTSIFSEFSCDCLIEEIKHYKKLKEWFTYIKDSNIIMNIDTNCDLIELDLDLPSYAIFLQNKLILIRSWSYNHVENTHLLLIKAINNKNLFQLFKLKKVVIIIKRHPEDKNRSVLTLIIKVSKSNLSSIFDSIIRKITIEICNSLNNFHGMIKMKKSLSENRQNKFNVNGLNSSDLNVSGFKFVINYFLNLELPKNKFNDYSNGIDTEKNNNNTKFGIRKLTNLNNDILLMKSYFEVKNEISSIYSDNYFLDNEIIRYTYGIKGDTNKIISALIELDKFRKNFRPNEIKQEEFESSLFQWDKFGQILCLDCHMRPVILIRLHYIKYIPNEQPNFCDKIIRYIIFIFNKAIFLMPTSVDKYVVIVDCKNSLLDNIPHEHLKKLSEFFKKFYVERLANIFIIKKGMMFPNLWNIVKEFFKQGEAMDKINIIKNYKEEFVGLISGEKINNI